MPSVVLINGSFGVGKTSVARDLRRRISGSVIYDPEWTGWAIQRLPSWVYLSGDDTDDFQDVNLWRSSVVAGIELVRVRHFGRADNLPLRLKFLPRKRQPHSHSGALQYCSPRNMFLRDEHLFLSLLRECNHSRMNPSTALRHPGFQRRNSQFRCDWVTG